jgi:hypothetical protein
MADQYDVSEFPVVEEKQQQPDIDMSKSVLSPDYRSRDAFGPQQIGGLIGGLTLGGVGTAVGGPVLGIPASAAGAGIGGFLGETFEQYTKAEKPSLSLAKDAGIEEAAWDLGGNLVLKGLGKTLRFGADKLGFTSKDAPDANKAAEAFLQQYGSSLPAGQRTGKNIFSLLEGVTTTPATYDLFRAKEKEIENALVTGSRDILKSLVKSPELDMALRTNTSSQYSSGQILQNFIKQGQDALSKAVDPIYKDIFTDKSSRVSMFGVRQYADKLLSDPAALTKGQRAILEEMRTLPPQVDVPLLHQIRSRWLAENRDKYASRVSSEKDSRAAGTISDLISKFDEAMDFSANKTLSKESLKKYRDVTRTYREGVQGLQTDAIQEALTKNAEDVGGFLFAAGKETPTLDLFKSVTAASKLSGKPSNEIIDALRYGYLEAMVNTPENMLKFAKNLEQDKAFANTYNRLFSNTPQDAAIKKMNEGAKLGLVESKALPGLNYRTTVAGLNVLGPVTALTTGYAFLLTPEQQQKITDNLGTATLAGGSLILSQRTLAKALLDPKGAKAISYLSTARDKLTSPTAFTKLVVEPLKNIITAEEKPESFFAPRDQYDVSNIPVK